MSVSLMNLGVAFAGYEVLVIVSILLIESGE